MAPQAPAEPAPRAIGYVFVSNTADGQLSAETAAVRECCEARGLDLTAVVHDIACLGREQRPSLVWALEHLANEQAEVLVVTTLDELSSNVADLAPLLSWFDVEQRTLIVIELQLDTSTEAGRIAVKAIAEVSRWQHERTSERSRRGVGDSHSRGAALGRTAVADVPELQRRIAAMRDQGLTLQAIADVLNEEGVPTLRGGAMWRPSSVQRATGYRRPSGGARGIELSEPSHHRGPPRSAGDRQGNLPGAS